MTNTKAQMTNNGILVFKHFNCHLNFVIFHSQIF